MQTCCSSHGSDGDDNDVHVKLLDLAPELIQQIVGDLVDTDLPSASAFGSTCRTARAAVSAVRTRVPEGMRNAGARADTWALVRIGTTLDARDPCSAAAEAVLGVLYAYISWSVGDRITRHDKCLGNVSAVQSATGSEIRSLGLLDPHAVSPASLLEWVVSNHAALNQRGKPPIFARVTETVVERFFVNTHPAAVGKYRWPMDRREFFVSTAVCGLGGRSTPECSQDGGLCAFGAIHGIDPITLSSLTGVPIEVAQTHLYEPSAKLHMALVSTIDHALGDPAVGARLSDWLDDQIAAHLPKRWAAARALSPDLFPRFTDLFRIDDARASTYASLTHILLWGKVRPKFGTAAFLDAANRATSSYSRASERRRLMVALWPLASPDARRRSDSALRGAGHLLASLDVD